MNFTLQKVPAKLAITLIIMASALSAQGQTDLCQSSASPGKRWSGELSSVWGGSVTTVSVTFGESQSFSYSVAFGTRIVLKATGRFSMQPSGERADRWPSACLITFQPTTTDVTPSRQELTALKGRAMFTGTSQTYRIDHSYGRGETMILLDVGLGPTSTFDMYFQGR